MDEETAELRADMLEVTPERVASAFHQPGQDKLEDIRDETPGGMMDYKHDFTPGPPTVTIIFNEGARPNLTWSGDWGGKHMKLAIKNLRRGYGLYRSQRVKFLKKQEAKRKEAELVTPAENLDTVSNETTEVSNG